MDRYIISLKNINEFDQYVVSWFIEVAFLYFQGIDRVDIHRLARSDYKSIIGQVHSEASNYLKEFTDPKVCEVPPIPLTTNDDKKLLTLCKAVDMLGEASREKIESYPIPPALSFEFTEYVRSYMPRQTDKFMKRQAVKIASDALALAILGAHISQVYRIDNEYAYSFVKTFHPSLIDVKRLHGMTKSVARAIAEGEGSRLALLVGVSAAIVLNLGRHLYEFRERALYTSVRITRTGQKTMLKAFERIDLTDLARTIDRLGIASPIYNLVIRYPRKEKRERDKSERTLRSIIEELAKAVLIYHNHRDVIELYRVLRTMSSEQIQSSLGSILDSWPMIRDSLLNIRV